MNASVDAEHYDDKIDAGRSQEVSEVRKDVSSPVEHTTDAFTRPADILPQVDLNGELQAIKNRLEVMDQYVIRSLQVYKSRPHIVAF